MSRPLLYVIAPYATRTPAEADRTDAAIRRGLELGWAPVFLPYVYRGILRDDMPAEREVALLACEGVIDKADAALVVGERITAGMDRDLAYYERDGMPVRYLFEWPELPPAEECFPK